MYFFSVDATDEPMSRPGRLVNHGGTGEANSKVAVKTAGSPPAPVLIIQATQTIHRGTEILYNY